MFTEDPPILTRYIARYERQDDQLWRAHVEEAPEVHVAGRSLSAAQARIRDLLRNQGIVELELVDEIELPSESRAAIELAADARAEALKSAERAHSLTREAAARLVADGLSLRDIATVLGISHTRVQQLLKSDHNPPAP